MTRSPAIRIAAPLLVAALAAALGAALGAGLLVGCSPKQSAAPKAAAAAPALGRSRHVTVAWVEGDAKINGAPAELGREIAADSRIETGPASRCDLVFDGRNVLSIGQNSLLSLGLDGLKASLTVERGGLSSVLKKLDKLASGDSFTINTVNAVAGVRGTSFCLWVDADSTYVCACNGEVHTIDAKGGNQQDLVSAHHVARLYTTKGGSITIAEAGILHHSDESLQSAADRIGYRIDWTKLDR